MFQGWTLVPRTYILASKYSGQEFDFIPFCSTQENSKQAAGKDGPATVLTEKCECWQVLGFVLVGKPCHNWEVQTIHNWEV